MHAQMTRRTFVATAGAAALALAGCSSNAGKPQPTTAATDTTTDIPWWKKTTVYEAYPRSFQSTTGGPTGDLRGVTRRLDHLQQLGVGAVWLTPVFVSPMADNGYDVANYLDIDPSFGTMEDMDQLIAKAADHGIKIVLDMVINHTSDQHPWFLDSRRSQTADKSDYYIWRDPAPDGGAPNNWESIFGGSAWTYVSERNQYYLHTFLPEQPDLNWENERVRAEMADVFNFWKDKGVGGFRIDAVTYIKKPEGLPSGEARANGMAPIHDETANTKGILEFLDELQSKTVAGTDVFLAGEANGVPASELNQWVGSNAAFDMLFTFPHVNLDGHDDSWSNTHEWRLTDLKDALTQTQTNTAGDGWCPVFFENHDQPRCVNEYFAPGCDHTLAAKVIAHVQYGLRGTPFVYQGQEIGMQNVSWPSIEDYNDVQSKGRYQKCLDDGLTPEQALAAVHRFSRDNARTPMQWDDTANAGFTQGPATWLPVHDDYATHNIAAQAQDDKSVLSCFKRLAQLRSGNDVLVSGTYAEIDHDNQSVYSYLRELDGRRVLVMANFTNASATAGNLPACQGGEVLSCTYEDSPAWDAELRPLEARIVELR